MVNAVTLLTPDLPETLDDLPEHRALSQPGPLESPAQVLPGDTFRPVATSPKTKVAPQSPIPAVHEVFSQPAAQDITRIEASLQQRVAELEGLKKDDSRIPVRSYAGTLREFQGKQLFTLGKYQLEGNRELGIVFSLKEDGSKVYFVTELGDDRPMSEAQFQQWHLQKLQSQVERTKGSVAKLQNVDLNNGQYQQEMAFSVGTQILKLAKDAQNNMSKVVEQLAQDAANLRKEVDSETLKTIDERGQAAAQSYGAVVADSAKEFQRAQSAVTGAGKAPSEAGSGTSPSSSGQKPPETAPAIPRASPEPTRSRDRVDIPVPGMGPVDLRSQEAEQQIGQEQELRAQQERDATQQQQLRRASERLAERMREFRKRIQKENELEKGEEMLMLLRISHASRRFEGRFASLAEKTFLTLIHSPLVRAPGQEDDA